MEKKKLYTVLFKKLGLDDLTKNELIEFIEYYDSYVIECCDEGIVPVCVEEFFYNDYPLLANKIY